MERFLAFPQFPVCTCRKWHQALGSLIFVEPGTLKAVNYFLSAGKSRLFSLHESPADRQLLHGTSVYPIYKKGSVDVLSSCLWSQSITKSCLWAQILPLKGACHLSRKLCQRKWGFPKWGYLCRGKCWSLPGLCSLQPNPVLLTGTRGCLGLMRGFVVWVYCFF